MQSRVYSVDEVRVEGLITIPENPPAISVSAKGMTNTSGWTHPDLAPWVYIVAPKDGILDLDFVATPPSGIALTVLSPIAVTKTFAIPRWVVGVRIHTSTNIAEAKLGGSQPSDPDPNSDGLPLPWPFPWWTPKSAAR